MCREAYVSEPVYCISADMSEQVCPVSAGVSVQISCVRAGNGIDITCLQLIYHVSVQTHVRASMSVRMYSRAGMSCVCLSAQICHSCACVGAEVSMSERA